jgi:uncharacterized Zn finger protein (UPF0148 family)
MSKPYQPTVICPRCGSPTKCATYEPRTRLEERTCQDYGHYFKRERPTRAEESARRSGWSERSETLRRRFQARTDKRLAAELAAKLPKLESVVGWMTPTVIKPAPAEVFCPHCDSAETEIETYGGEGENDLWRCDCGARWELNQSERQ